MYLFPCIPPKRPPVLPKPLHKSFMETESRLDILSWFLVLLPFTSTKNHLGNNAALYVFLSFIINIPDDSFRFSDLGKPLRNQAGIQDNMGMKYIEMFCGLRPSVPYISDVTFLDYHTKEAWNHKLSWTLLPKLSRYSESNCINLLHITDVGHRIF